MCQLCEVSLRRQSETDNLYEVWQERGERYAKLSVDDIALALKAEGADEVGGEAFLADELLIASALGVAVSAIGEDARKALLSILEKGGHQALDKAIEEVRPIMQEAFSYKTTEKKVAEAIARLIRTGSVSGGLTASSLDSMATRQQVLEGMVESSKYYTNNYFNTQVVPKLYNAVDDAIAVGGDIDASAYTAVREGLEKRLSSTPYWRTVANGAASRSYHYGMIKAGMITGRRTYRFKAVIDAATTAICFNMNRREFWLPDAERQIMRAANARGEEIKTVSPFVSAEDIVGKRAAELVEQGTIIPPLHFNCRSTIVLI